MPGAENTIPALIDTGAAVSLIDYALATKFFTPTEKTLEIGGVGQGEEYPTFDIEVRIPELQRDVPGPVASAPLLESGVYDLFVVGRDVLADYVVTFDLVGRTADFHPR